MDADGEGPVLWVLLMLMFVVGLVLVFVFPPTIIVAVPPAFWAGLVLMAIPVLLLIGTRGEIGL